MDKIKKIMLGHLADNIELVIITPLKSTFCRLKETLEIEQVHNNVFFENCTFKVNKENKRGLLVLSPQGIASKDIIELFNNTSILFFGLAGSVNTNIEIGRFVEVKAIVDEKGNIEVLTTTEKFEKVKCGYSPCLLGTIAKEHCELARSMHCDVVDMETVYCAKTAAERNNKFTALLLISDIPETINFWELSNQMQQELKKNRILATDKIVDYINLLLERK